MRTPDSWDRCAGCQGPLLRLTYSEVQARFWEVERSAGLVRLCEACYRPADQGRYIVEVHATHHGRSSMGRTP